MLVWIRFIAHHSWYTYRDENGRLLLHEKMGMQGQVKYSSRMFFSFFLLIMFFETSQVFFLNSFSACAIGGTSSHYESSSWPYTLLFP